MAMNTNVFESVALIITRGWTKTVPAITKEGKRVFADDGNAVAWSIEGAFRYVTGEYHSREKEHFFKYIRYKFGMHAVKWEQEQRNIFFIVKELRAYKDQVNKRVK